MKKIVTIFAFAAFLFSVDASAQEPVQTQRSAAKTEKSCCSADKKEAASADKKSCSSDAKQVAGTEAKKSCCSSKKEVAKKED
jgi:hypothetical protein